MGDSILKNRRNNDKLNWKITRELFKNKGWGHKCYIILLKERAHD